MMLHRRTAAPRMFVLILTAASLAGCAATPLAPTVQVRPGRTKSVEQFQVDDSFCRQYAGDQVRGAVRSANSLAVAAMLTRDEDDDSPPITGASQQYSIQVEYDRSYGKCMYVNHNIVPGFGPVRSRVARPVRRSTPVNAEKASATAPTPAAWVAPTTASSSTAAGSSSGGSSGWVTPAKTQ